MWTKVISGLAITATLSGCGALFSDRNGQGGTGDGVNNGGDPVRLLTVQGKFLAPDMVRTYEAQTEALPLGPSVDGWIGEHRDALADDIVETPHVWSGRSQVHCAETARTLAAPIQFSFDECRVAIPYLEQATRLLIHESTHHLGVEDEEFAEQVAIAILASWREREKALNRDGDSLQPPDAEVKVNGGRGVATMLEVQLEVESTSGTHFIKFAEDRDFTEARWQNIKSLMSYKFETPGAKVLYYRVASASALESSTFSLPFTIDLFSDGQDLFRPAFAVDNPVVGQGDLELRLRDIVVPAKASEMMVTVDNVAMTLGAWQAPAGEVTLDLAGSTTCGEHTVFLKFRTDRAFESAVGTKKFSVVCP